MAKSSQLLALFTAVSLFIVACKSDNSSSSTSEKYEGKTEEGIVIPPKPQSRTSEDVPFFECMVDGNVFESATARGSYIVDETSGKVLVDMSAVSGKEPGKDYITMIGVVLESFKGEGNYDGYKSFYYKRIVQGAPEMLEWESQKGSINVTKWDEDQKLLSGTFSTTVKNDKGKTIRIDGGRFKNVPLEVLKVK